MALDHTNRDHAGPLLSGRRNLIKGLAVAGIAGAEKLLAETLSASRTAGQPAIRSPQVEQWGLQEIALRSDAQYSNPFKQVQLHGAFSCGTETINAEGFFDDDSTWRVRLMPGKQGHWTFTTKSIEPSLNRKAGEFEVTAPRPGNHGPAAQQFRSLVSPGVVRLSHVDTAPENETVLPVAELLQKHFSMF